MDVTLAGLTDLDIFLIAFLFLGTVFLAVLLYLIWKLGE